jgi:hypothetical protein
MDALVHTIRSEGTQRVTDCHSATDARHGQTTSAASRTAGTRIAGSRTTGGHPRTGAPTSTVDAATPINSSEGRGRIARI